MRDRSCIVAPITLVLFTLMTSRGRFSQVSAIHCSNTCFKPLKNLIELGQSACFVIGLCCLVN